MAANKFKEVMHETQDQDWKDWLKSASQQDLYITNKYISSEPSDYSNAWIPTLCTSSNGLPNLAESNPNEAAVLADSFFPPPPVRCQVPPNQTYPTPLEGPCFFSRSQICQVIHMLSPYKVPGPDKIPNVMLMKCVDALIDHLFYIFRAVFKLKVYHPVIYTPPRIPSQSVRTPHDFECPWGLCPKIGLGKD